MNSAYQLFVFPTSAISSINNCQSSVHCALSGNFPLCWFSKILNQKCACVPMILKATLHRRHLQRSQGLPGGSAVKNPPATQERQISSLGWENPLEKKMATHSNILAGEILWTEEPGGLQSMVSRKSRTQFSDCNSKQQKGLVQGPKHGGWETSLRSTPAWSLSWRCFKRGEQSIWG